MMRERETFRGGVVVVVAGMGVHGIEHFFVTRKFFLCHWMVEHTNDNMILDDSIKYKIPQRLLLSNSTIVWQVTRELFSMEMTGLRKS